jgi:hypothetical protein
VSFVEIIGSYTTLTLLANPPLERKFGSGFAGKTCSHEAERRGLPAVSTLVNRLLQSYEETA